MANHFTVEVEVEVEAEAQKAVVSTVSGLLWPLFLYLRVIWVSFNSTYISL